MKIILPLLIATMLIAGCNITGNTPKETITEQKIIENNNKSIEIYFCPRDECEQKHLELINSAKQSVHCAFFETGQPSITEALINQSKTKDVKLFTDNEYYEKVKNLSFAKQDNTNQLSHNKFCIIDNETISTGSTNPSVNGIYYNNNNLVIIHSKYLAENYEDEFQEVWNKTFGKGQKVKYPVIYYNGIKLENYFCPEDSCGKHVIEILEQTNKSIHFLTFSFTHDGIAKILALKNYEGKLVTGVYEKRNLQDSTYEMLKYQGAEVKPDNNPSSMHHKVFIIDEKIVITGSFNPTKSADTKNDENVLIIHDQKIAKQFMQEFYQVWNFTTELDTQPHKAENVVLSEIYYDAPGSDTGKEYIKLYNPTNQTINLNYWRLTNNESTEILNGEIKPKQEITIKPKFSMKNQNGLIILKNKAIQQQDFAAYEGIWKIEAKEGEAIKRKSHEKTNNPEEWITAKII